MLYEGWSRSNRTFAITIVHVKINKKNVYEMKAGSLIDNSAEFQTNRLMVIKSAQHLVRLVPGKWTECNVILTSSCKHNRCKVKGAVTYHRIVLTDAERTEKMQKTFIRWRKSSRWR